MGQSSTIFTKVRALPLANRQKFLMLVKAYLAYEFFIFQYFCNFFTMVELYFSFISNDHLTLIEMYITSVFTNESCIICAFLLIYISIVLGQRE